MKSKSAKVPQRTCLVCRRKVAKKSLCRLVRDGDALYYDFRFRSPGRGYYICRSVECLTRFLEGKRRFGRLPLGAEALNRESRERLQVECEKITDCDVGGKQP
ncbi:MAG: YlxR family protein [Deltaproteobacteria bacterium]|nr:YlxR family protein [Deltaproteobacteria bacterium]